MSSGVFGPALRTTLTTYFVSMAIATVLGVGAGIGGRFYTNFGPIRIDVATPLNKRKGDSRIALYISIGQAF